MTCGVLYSSTTSAKNPRIGFLVGLQGTNIWRVWLREQSRVVRVREVVFDESQKFDPRAEPLTSKLAAELAERVEIVQMPDNNALERFEIGKTQTKNSQKCVFTRSVVESGGWWSGQRRNYRFADTSRIRNRFHTCAPLDSNNDAAICEPFDPIAPREAIIEEVWPLASGWKARYVTRRRRRSRHQTPSSFRRSPPENPRYRR